ncbi:FAD-binding oxidoreductase (plasmid) [Ralstonia solanacearum]|uniref:NAD(P)/FAD-dependent oxidoreductase n=1 Tax=Ralstonia pseudosolanacearum TaxID=1310165 RepID=UPI000B6154ED|nr:FAD-binding oxidoreductase [Ralstonia pseudosolanacearum]AXV75287.1 FAD-binding oxidoreductase [Ralstonia solanacearum]ASL75712.1 oxidoreductase [Ralstonia pseudosolanacearum]AXW41282.1 FAD-binding oxidoreductase [Ralstonia solanacearum]AXW74076.1 FAD-binding oxidoreductase [Ralstonia solanacearum]MCK4119409.1 FAD-binding oxidoreductase [Ralstonia pseudosolanacearum]
MAMPSHVCGPAQPAFDVAIVGAGLAGAAAAHFCAQRGLRVALVEAASAGAGGATAHSRGIVRVYDPSEALMALGQRGTAFWRGWDLGEINPFRPCGVLYVAPPASLPQIEARLRSHDQASYPIRILGRAEVRQVAGRLPSHVHEGAVVLHEPLGGCINPRLAAQLFAESARRRAATVIEGSPVQRIEATPDAAVVHTGAGAVHARTVVVAAGALTRRLVGAQAPVDAGQHADRVAAAFVRSIPLGCVHDPDAGVPEYCLIDEPSGGYLRPESDALAFVGGARQSDVQEVDALPALAQDQYERTATLADRLLGTERARLIDMRGGYDAYTPDLLPIVGFTDDRSRVAVAFGFSGRGAKYIPALMSDFAGDIVHRVRHLN